MGGAVFLINKELVQIIEAYKTARNKISDADELAKRMNVLLEEDRNKFEKKYAEKSDKETEENSKKQQTLISMSKEEYSKRLEDAKDKIEKLANENTNKWIHEIICSVTQAE